MVPEYPLGLESHGETEVGELSSKPRFQTVRHLALPKLALTRIKRGRTHMIPIDRIPENGYRLPPQEIVQHRVEFPRLYGIT
jgi:hypothetical protein